MIREKLKQLGLKFKNGTIKKKLLEFFKNPREVISFFLPIVIAIILILPVSYTVTVGGGTINIDKKIEVKNGYKSEGTLDSAYVKELEGRVITYLLAKIIPSYTLTPLEEVTLENETEENYTYREKTYFNSSLDSATLVAYKYANKEIKIKEEQIYVMYILEDADTNLLVKDQILEIEENRISSVNDISEILKNYEVNDILNVKVLRNKKEVDCYFRIKSIDNAKKIGIYLNTKYIYEADPKISFNFTNKESGPSGGLIIALSIYNKLTEDDITKGKIIVGTGTIDKDGNVGEIGGVKEKLQGAVKKKADIFIVPAANYEEAINLKLANNYNIEIVSVKTFSEALEKLNNIS